MKTRILFLLTVCLMAVTTAFGQSRTVKGQVVSAADSEPLFGVAIVEKGTNNGVISDQNGKFSIQVKNDAVLTVSCVGFIGQSVKATSSNVTIRLQEDVKSLDDLVVIGYGVQKKSDLTGAVSSVSADDIKGLATSDAAAALQGKAAGIQIINSGDPGAGAEIRVRGYSSNSGNIGPLLIVDGLKVDNIQYLDPSMIESMEILKDAASAAIYGAQAGNGVVLITTKTGAEKGGTSQVTYSFKASRQTLGKKAELFNAKDYIDYQKYIGKLNDAKLQSINYDGTDTDWYDEAFEPSWSTQHSLTVSGGNKQGHFMTSLNLLNNNGIVKGDKDVYKRFTAQINADYNLFKWLNVSTNNSIEKWSTKGVTRGYQSTLNSVTSIDPLTKPYLPANATEDMFGILMWQKIQEGAAVPTTPDGGYYGTSKTIEDATGNPLWQIARRNNENSGLTVRGTAAANLMPVKGLTVTSRLGYRINQSNAHNYDQPWWLSSMAHGDNYSISADANNGLYYQWENFANYVGNFGKHSVGAMVGMSFTKHHNDNVHVESNGSEGKPILSSDKPNFQYINYLLADAQKGVGNAPSDAAELAYFGRLSYSYDNRYFLQANFRADAFDNSKLSPTNRWGYFPSVSAGWTISNEKFIKDNVSEDILSFLKIRASWGRNGNINVLNNYRWASTIGLNSVFYQWNPSSNSGAQALGSKPTGLANPDLKWETSEQLDLGIDARFLNNRLTLGIDYYNKNTKDLLISVAPLPEIGVASSWINAGKVNNSGLDIELGWRDQIGDLKYSVNTNFSTLHNEVKEVSSLVDRLTQMDMQGFNNQLVPTFEKGHNVWYFRGYNYAGVSNGQNKDRDGNAIAEGRAMYYDKNGNITTAPSEEDKTDLGSGIPNFTYGITLSLEYKGFDFTVFGTGAAGNKIYNLMVSADRPEINGINTYWLNSWKQAGDNAKYPDMKTVATDWTFFSSSAAVHNGSFFKFKQIQLGYTLPKSITKKALINDLRVFVSLDDFFTITSYVGADPETSSFNGGSSRGIDNGMYPTSKKLTLGASLTF